MLQPSAVALYMCDLLYIQMCMQGNSMLGMLNGGGGGGGGGVGNVTYRKDRLAIMYLRWS